MTEEKKDSASIWEEAQLTATELLKHKLRYDEHLKEKIQAEMALGQELAEMLKLENLLLGYVRRAHEIDGTIYKCPICQREVFSNEICICGGIIEDEPSGIYA